jgi:hypothetical protein
MKSSPEGLVPARGFLEAGMATRPSFNDGSKPGENNQLFVGYEVLSIRRSISPSHNMECQSRRI